MKQTELGLIEDIDVHKRLKQQKVIEKAKAISVFDNDIAALTEKIEILLAARDAKIVQRDLEADEYDALIAADQLKHGQKIENLKDKLKVVTFQLKALAVEKIEDIDHMIEEVVESQQPSDLDVMKHLDEIFSAEPTGAKPECFSVW